MSMRLQKFMAYSGVSSRRGAERLIREGRVLVDGKVVLEPGISVDPDSSCVMLDNRKIKIQDSHEYWLFYKPAGVLTTVKDPFGRPTVMDYFRNSGSRRLYPVGRLDYDSEGLLIMTDDGELANRMLHPRYKLKKTYHVTVKGRPSSKDIELLSSGVMLDDRKTLPCSIEIIGTTRRQTVLSVVLKEGKKRQIRRMFDTVKHPVLRLLRVSSGPLNLGDMKPGAKRVLAPSEVEAIKKMCGYETFSIE